MCRGLLAVQQNKQNSNFFPFSFRSNINLSTTPSAVSWIASAIMQISNKYLQQVEQQVCTDRIKSTTWRRDLWWWSVQLNKKNNAIVSSSLNCPWWIHWRSCSFQNGSRRNVFLRNWRWCRKWKNFKCLRMSFPKTGSNKTGNWNRIKSV